MPDASSPSAPAPVLERYTRVLRWDNGYLEVLAKYRQRPSEIEGYIDQQRRPGRCGSIIAHIASERSWRWRSLFLLVLWLVFMPFSFTKTGEICMQIS